MSDEPEESVDPMGALMGTPVDPSRKHQGLSQGDYLERPPGEMTLHSLENSGIIRRQRVRKLKKAGLVVAILGAVAAVVWAVLAP